MSIDELNDLLDGNLPDDDWDTVGGLVFSTLEHVPIPGEDVEFEGWHFTVVELEGRRVRLVRVRPADPVPDTDDDSSEFDADAGVGRA